MNLYGYKHPDIESDDNNLFYISIYLEIYSLALEFVSNEFKTQQLCLIAVNSNALSLVFVPYELKTLELCSYAISLNGLVLEFKSEELCVNAVTLNGLAI
jgi:hypothetical protein